MRSVAPLICAAIVVLLSGRGDATAVRAEEEAAVPEPIGFTPRNRPAPPQGAEQAGTQPPAADAAALPEVERLRGPRTDAPPPRLTGSLAGMQTASAALPADPQSTKRAPRRSEDDEDERPSPKRGTRISCTVFGDTQCAGGN